MPAETQSMNLESLHAIATMVAQQRSVDAVLETVVESLVESLDLALARIWLNRPGDICAECPTVAMVGLAPFDAKGSPAQTR